MLVLRKLRWQDPTDIHYNRHNLYALEESMATHRVIANITGERPFALTRSDGSRTHRSEQPVCNLLAGHALKRHGLHMSMSISAGRIARHVRPSQSCMQPPLPTMICTHASN